MLTLSRKKILNILFVAISLIAFSAQSLVRDADSDQKIRRAHYLAMSNSEKIDFILSILGLHNSTRYQNISNLKHSDFFRAQSTSSSNLPSSVLFSAKAALKQYELDSRENVTMLLTAVVFESIDQDNSSTDTPWAIVIAKQTLNTKGEGIVTPVAIYSIERNSSGVIYKRLGSRFGDNVL